MSTADRPEPRIETWPPTRHPSVAPPSLREGALFAGRYRIVEELGRGGMGVVSRARDTRLPRDVAIKVPLHLADPEAIRRFRQEAEAAAMLEHPNICRVLDVGESDGLPFIVLSFIRGRTLADVMRRRKLGAYQAARLVRSVARTIAFAPRGGDRPSRPQAGEPHDRPSSRADRDGLRPRPPPRPGARDADRAGLRDAAVHVARAGPGPGRADGQGMRHLYPGRHLLRAPDRLSTVPGAGLGRRPPDRRRRSLAAIVELPPGRTRHSTRSSLGRWPRRSAGDSGR